MNDRASGAAQRLLRIHHVGFAVEQIERYIENSIWLQRSDIVYDPLQNARLCLVAVSEADSPIVELVQPSESGPGYAALMRGELQHHVCFEAPSSEIADDFIRQHRLLPISHWKPAKLFDGRQVRFAYTRQRELVEFITDE